jgi:hypothetical protein
LDSCANIVLGIECRNNNANEWHGSLNRD